MFCYIIVFWKTFDDVWYTYCIPDFLLWEIQKWQIVEIPFWEKIEYWVIYKIFEKLNEDIKKEKIKPIISIKNNNLFIKNYRLKLLVFIASNYFTPIHNSLNLFLPKNLVWKVIKEKLDFEKTNQYNYNFNLKFNLSDKQQEIFDKIVNEEKNNKFMLHWITWSWKTEIYIKLIERYIKNEKQVLLLIPEIILTNQISKRLIKVFWKNILVLNSTVTDAKKTQYFLDINSSNAKIIIWTRSSLFYPYNNLWLIIVDEEHDNSYISDQSPRYNAIEIANKITDLNWNKLLLASWTPSINSMYKALKWDYKLLSLLEKYVLKK